MILPTKSIKPIDSLFCISSYIIELACNEQLTIDGIHSQLKNTYPAVITIETVILCINYLYIVGKLETDNEIIKIKL
jgi:hypothetical protein